MSAPPRDEFPTAVEPEARAGMPTSALRVGQNQSLSRSVNEQIESTSVRFGVVSEQVEFVCECAVEDCTERVTLTLAEYEKLRRVPTRFIVKPGHVYLEFERVVEEVNGYAVVEKLGEAAAEARILDRRGGPPGLQP
jgi:hypothetical protein